MLADERPAGLGLSRLFTLDDSRSIAPRALPMSPRPCGGAARHRRTPSIAILPATVQHAAPLAANLRPSDRAEAEGVYDDVVGGFAWAIRDSAEAWVACQIPAGENGDSPIPAGENGEIIAAWGVVDEGSLLVPVGRVWCMTTPLLEQHARHFARESRRIVSHWRQRYWRLHNCVDARYTVSVRWLRWMGFTVGEPWPDAERGLLWQNFWWQADS